VVHLVKRDTREERRSILPSIGMLGRSDKDYMVKVRQSVGKLNGLVFSVKLRFSVMIFMRRYHPSRVVRSCLGASFSPKMITRSISGGIPNPMW
jgi:hypothetical protein